MIRAPGLPGFPGHNPDIRPGIAFPPPVAFLGILADTGDTEADITVDQAIQIITVLNDSGDDRCTVQLLDFII